MSIRKPAALIVLVIILVSFSNCGNAKSGGESVTFQKNPPFKIENVTVQKTVSGIKDGGTNTTVTIAPSKMTEGVKFNVFYYKKQMEAVKLSPINSTQYNVYFGEKKDFIMDSDPLKEAENSARTPFPFTLNDDEAVISYTYKNKLAYYKISSIETLETIYAPTQNPNIDNGLNKQ